MPWTHKPRAGSMGYWPRKRANRAYPAIKRWPSSGDAKPLVFAGYKAGMLTAHLTDNRKGSATQGQDVAKAVTVLDCPPMFVVGIRGYSSNVPKISVFCTDLPKNLKGKVIKGNKKIDELEKIDNITSIRLICCTQPGKTGIGKKKADLFEVPLGGTVENQLSYGKEKLGKELPIAEIFKEGDYVDAIAVTIGKGFQGAVQRFGVTIQTRKKKRGHRKVGAIGTEGMQRLLHTVPMPGQMGYHRRTDHNKAIVKIGKDEKINPISGFTNYGIVTGDYCLVDGSVPGPRKRLIMMRSPMRKRTGFKFELKSISLNSQQG